MCFLNLQSADDDVNFSGLVVRTSSASISILQQPCGNLVLARCLLCYRFWSDTALTGCIRWIVSPNRCDIWGLGAHSGYRTIHRSRDLAPSRYRSSSCCGLGMWRHRLSTLRDSVKTCLFKLLFARFNVHAAWHHSVIACLVGLASEGGMVKSIACGFSSDNLVFDISKLLLFARSYAQSVLELL